MEPGAIGEVCLGSSAVMEGYWRNSGANAEVFTADGSVRTGDLGWVDERGRLHLAGRSRERYVRGGYNVYPMEVEAVLADHPDVAAVAVVSRNDPVMGEVGVAVVVPRADGPDPRTRHVARLRRRAPGPLQAPRGHGGAECAAAHRRREGRPARARAAHRRRPDPRRHAPRRGCAAVTTTAQHDARPTCPNPGAGTDRRPLEQHGRRPWRQKNHSCRRRSLPILTTGNRAVQRGREQVRQACPSSCRDTATAHRGHGHELDRGRAEQCTRIRGRDPAARQSCRRTSRRTAATGSPPSTTRAPRRASAR